MSPQYTQYFGHKSLNKLRDPSKLKNKNTKKRFFREKIFLCQINHLSNTSALTDKEEIKISYKNMY